MLLRAGKAARNSSKNKKEKNNLGNISLLLHSHTEGHYGVTMTTGTLTGDWPLTQTLSGVCGRVSL